MLLLTLTLIISNLTPEQVSLINAIIQVESSGNDDAVGDNGRAFGCLQIHKNYWIDSKIPGEHKDCFNRQYAIQVFSSYMTRYAKEAWTDPNKFDPEKIAKIHNGGPTGYRKEATKKYWKKVEDQLNEKSSMESSLESSLGYSNISSMGSSRGSSRGSSSGSSSGSSKVSSRGSSMESIRGVRGELKMRKMTKFEELDKFNYGYLVGFIEGSKEPDIMSKKGDELMKYIQDLLKALKEAEESLENMYGRGYNDGLDYRNER